MADRCEKVLAADCSPSNDLAVTSKPADSDPDKQVRLETILSSSVFFLSIKLRYCEHQGWC